MRLPRNPGWAMCGGLVVGLAALIGLGGSFSPTAPTPKLIRLAKGNAAGLAAVPEKSRAQSEAVAAKYDRLPLAFEPNRAQVDSQVQFLARGVGYTLFLTPEESVLALRRRSKADSVLRVKLAGSNTHASFAGREELLGKSNYIIGTRAENWHTNIPTYREVARRDIYRGIDVIYYGTQRQLEYDFVVSPGANPRVIQLDFQGAENLRTDSAGNLIVSVADGELRMQRPLAYQQVAGEKHAVAANYIVHGPRVTSPRFLSRTRVISVAPILKFQAALQLTPAGPLMWPGKPVRSTFRCPIRCRLRQAATVMRSFPKSVSWVAWRSTRPVSFFLRKA